MLSGNFYKYPVSSAAQFGLYCEWSGAQDVAGNYTDITVNVYLSYWNIDVGAKTCTVSAGGASTTFTSPRVYHYNNAWTKKLLGTATVRVSHDGDGSKKNCTISVTFPFGGTMSGVSVTSITASTAVDLNTIPRASVPTVSASSVYFGGGITIYTNRKSTAFTHTLTFSFGNVSNTIGTGVGDSYPWYPDLSLAGQIPSSWSGTATIACTTYSGSALVGTKYISVTLMIPDNNSTNPSVSISSVVPISNLSSPFNAMYLQGLTKVSAKYSVATPYSTLSKVSLSLIDSAGSVCNTVTGGNSSAQSGTITSSGTVTVKLTAYNGRGQSNSDTVEISVKEYSPPSVSVSVCERCDEVGTPKKTGLKLGIKASRSYASLDGQNTCELRYRIKKYDGTPFSENAAWMSLISAEDVSADTFSGIVCDVDKKIAYSVEIGAIDSLGKKSSVIKYVKTSLVNLHLGSGGDRAAFGMWCQQAGLEVGFETQFDYGYRLQEKEIVIDGDKDTYYPVWIAPTYRFNTQPVFLGIGKQLGSLSPAWDGNHAGTATSSLTVGWLFRYGGWDGNGNYCNTLYKVESYAKLISGIVGQQNAVHGVVVYLRGGGASYRICCSAPYDCNVYLEETSLSGSTDYPCTVTPTTEIGNGGILYASAGLDLQ